MTDKRQLQRIESKFRQDIQSKGAYAQILKGPNSGHKFYDILGNRVPLTHLYIQNFDF